MLVPSDPAGSRVKERTCKNNGTCTPAATLSSRTTARENILETPLIEPVESGNQGMPGEDRQDTLPRQCLERDPSTRYNGECPRNCVAADGAKTRLTYLCDGDRACFTHADPAFGAMADLVRRSRRERRRSARPERPLPPCGAGERTSGATRLHTTHGG